MIREEYWLQQSHRPKAVSQYLQANVGTAPRKRSISVASAAAEEPPAKRFHRHCQRPRGHTKAECFAYGGDRVGQYPEWFRGPRNIHLPSSERNGSAQTGGQFSANVATANSQTANSQTITSDTIEASTALSQEHHFYALNTTSEGNVICHSEAIVSNSADRASPHCYHDSGANRHIFFDRGLFRNYREIEPIAVKAFGSTLTTSATGVGSIVFETSCNGNKSTIELSNVLHVPGARLNLISQGCLERHGIHCRSVNGNMVLSYEGREIVSGALLPNNLYRLRMVPIRTELKDRISEVFSAQVPGKGGADFYTAF